MMSTQLHMEGLVKDRASWRTSGQVRFDQGTIAVESLDEPIQDAFVVLRFDQDKVKSSGWHFVWARATCGYPAQSRIGRSLQKRD